MRRTIVYVAILATIVASASWAATTQQTITIWNDPGYPLNMQGWVTARGDLTNNGNTWTSTGAITFSQLAEGGSPSPPGALYIKNGDGYNKITQSWVGTDQYAGVKASDVTRLTYYTYTVLRGWGSAGAGAPNYKCDDWGHFAQQPVQLQISFKKSPTDTQYVHLMYRPWGLKGELRSFAQYEVWQYWDALAADAVWWDGLIDNNGGSNYGNWDYFFNPTTGLYPDAVITTPCAGTYAGKWGENECLGDQYMTATGGSVNLVVGARAFSVTWPDGLSSAWWQESCFTEGYADNFTIGVKDSLGDIIETTWDFERYAPSTYPWKGGTYGIKNRDRTTPAVYGNARYRQYFAMWGKVTDAGSIPYKFTMDDGSGNPVLVVASNADAWVLPDDYVMVSGAVSKRRTICLDPPYQIGYYFTAEPNGVTLIYQ